MPNKPLLEFTDRGIYCEKGGFYIDPWKPVDYAVITHAHADHAYIGHKHYLAHHLSKQVLLYRLGEIDLQTVEYGDQTILAQTGNTSKRPVSKPEIFTRYFASKAIQVSSLQSAKCL